MMPLVLEAPKVIGGLLVAACLFATSGCANRGPGPMYMWGNFPRQQYSALLREGASPDEQIRDMQAQAEKVRGANAALPPGFRAHLGMLQLAAGNPDQAKELWEAERAAFPESAPYMNQLLRKLNAPAAPKSGSPA